VLKKKGANRTPIRSGWNFRTRKLVYQPQTPFHQIARRSFRVSQLPELSSHNSRTKLIIKNKKSTDNLADIKKARQSTELKNNIQKQNHTMLQQSKIMEKRI